MEAEVKDEVEIEGEDARGMELGAWGKMKDERARERKRD